MNIAIDSPRSSKLITYYYSPYPLIILALWMLMVLVTDPLSNDIPEMSQLTQIKLFLAPLALQEMIRLCWYLYQDNRPAKPRKVSDYFKPYQEQHELYMQFINTRPLDEYVYIIRDIDVTGHYKIGHSNDLYRRLGTFEVKLPFHICVVELIHYPKRKQFESYLHQKYKTEGKHVNGEWFALTDTDIAEIRRLYSHRLVSNGHSSNGNGH